MGILKKMKQLTGAPSKELLENGLLGRGIVLSVEVTKTTMGDEMSPSPVCVFTVEVSLDNQNPYQATCRQAIPYTVVPQFVPGQTVVAVRVNPQDPSEIALDLATEPPTVTVSQSTSGFSAAEILANGASVRAVIVQTQPLGKKNQEGFDFHAFLFTILSDGQPPRQVQVGNAVPPAAVPLLYPGSNLPAKVMASEPDGVVVDWAAAVAEASK
jgi:hypothetical protein